MASPAAATAHALEAARPVQTQDSDQALTGKHATREARRPRRSTPQLDRRLRSGKAREGGIRWRGAWWSPARGYPVDYSWVVPACLLTRQHRGQGLGCRVRHRHREDPLGVPAATRARRRRRGRAHGHPLLETAAVAAAILVGGHSALQGCHGRGRQAGTRKQARPMHPPRQGRAAGLPTVSVHLGTDRVVLS
jgi:hypothetical protein